MATTITKTLKPSGGDYTTMAAWEADNGGAASKDLVTNNCIVRLEMYKGDYTAVGGGVNFIEEKYESAMFSWDTDDARYKHFVVPESERHDGTPGSGFYWQSPAFNRCIRARAGSGLLKVTGLDFLGDRNECVVAQDTHSEFNNCIFRVTGTTSDNLVSTGGLPLAAFFNCLFLEESGASISSLLSLGSNRNCRVNNCTFVGGDKGIKLGNGATIFVNNCVGYDQTTDFLFLDVGDTLNPSSEFSHNASSNNSTYPLMGTNNYAGDVVAADFADAANDDYHLSASSALLGIGTNLYSWMQEDVDGEARPAVGAWDIGFDHYGAPPSSAPTLTLSTVTNITVNGATLGCTVTY